MALTNKTKWISLLALLCAAPGFAKFGDIVQVNARSAIPAGWVITKTTGSTNMGTVMIREEVRKFSRTHTIKDLYLAPYGTRETVVGGSPIPAGWVITKVSNPDPSSNATVLEILCLIEAGETPCESKSEGTLASAGSAGSGVALASGSIAGGAGGGKIISRAGTGAVARIGSTMSSGSQAKPAKGASCGAQASNCSMGLGAGHR